MNWYYVEGERRVGPITETEKDELVRTNKIGPETHVWHEGMGEWKRYDEVNSVGATTC